MSLFTSFELESINSCPVCGEKKLTKYKRRRAYCTSTKCIGLEVDELLERASRRDDETRHLREKRLRKEKLLREDVRHVQVIYQDKIDKLRNELAEYESLLIVKIGNRKIVTKGLFAKALAAHKRVLLNKVKKSQGGKR